MDMAERLPEINFLLVGGEPGDTVDLRDQVKSHGLENVFIIGFVPNADLPWFQAACEVLLMPYQPRVEASSGGDIARFLSPMKMFEYLACGRAILSSDLPVLQEVLSPTNAVLLPPGEIEYWVKALVELCEHPQQRIALASQARRDAEQFSWEARVMRIMDGLS
jgi:glycosyltransferase involved in cell wall biosynthesis